VARIRRGWQQVALHVCGNGELGIEHELRSLAGRQRVARGPKIQPEIQLRRTPPQESRR